ncbi:MAG: V-type ATP synthase subunit E [Coriobacteriia bacterium]|nr:V-type ATP synthase subunit E [Coriobacteriia bacterium]
MAIKNILVAIEEQAREEIAEILRLTDEKAKKLLDETRKSAEAEGRRFVDSTVSRDEREAVRALHSASIVNGRSLSDVRAKAYAHVVEQAGVELTKIRATEGYQKIICALCKDAIIGLGESVIVHVDPVDGEVLNSEWCSKQQCVQHVEIMQDIITTGGIKVTSADGRIMRDNTFEARLDRVKDARAKEIWQVLDS